MRLLFILMAALLLESCGTITVKDEILYGNKGMLGAVEYHTLAATQKEVSFEDWMQTLRTQPMVCTSVNTVADVKAAFEQMCSICNCCSYDTTEAAETLFSNLQKMGKK